MFGNGGPLINRAEARYTRAPEPAPFFPPTGEPQPRPDVVGHMLEPATRPPTLAEAFSAITAAIMKTVTNDDTDATALSHDWSAFSNRIRKHLGARKGAHPTELRKQDEDLTKQGRALVERIAGLQQEASAIRGSFNVQEETRSQLSLRLQALGQNPERRNDPGFDPDEVFLTAAEIADWKARVADATAKLQAQQAAVDVIRDRLVGKENEIEKVSRELARIKQERKGVRAELRGEYITGPHGLRTWKVPEL